MMSSTASAPSPTTLSVGIVTSRLRATCEFYASYLGFREVESRDGVVVLAGLGGVRLQVRSARGENLPAALQIPTRGSGLWFTIEVENIAPLFARLKKAGVELIADLESTPTGARRFVVRDPNGVLVHVQEASARPLAFSSTHYENSHDNDHRPGFHRLSGN